MDIRCLKTFIVAAKYENFRMTSEELFLTQPAITKHIKRLEKQLNTLLFERVGKAVFLTAAGHRFLPTAKEIVDRFEHGISDFEAWKQGFHKRIIIATAPQIASSFLPKLLSAFMERNPNIELVINVVKSYDIGEEISSGRADLGLTRIQPIQMNINSEIIHEDRVVLVSPNHSKRLNEEISLQKYRLITYNHPDYWDHLLVEIKKHYPYVRTMTVNQVEVTKRFIEEGLGVSYLPLSVVKEDIEKHKLQRIKPDKIASPISATYVITKVETEETLAFISFLKSVIGDI